MIISSRTSLRQIIEKRIGMEAFTDKLTQVTKSESYTRAIKKPHLNYKQANEVVFDFEFTKLFKRLERKLNLTINDEKKIESFVIFTTVHFTPENNYGMKNEVEIWL